MVPQISCTGCRDSTLKEARRITAQARHILALFIHTYIHTYMHTCISAYIHTCIHIPCGMWFLLWYLVPSPDNCTDTDIDTDTATDADRDVHVYLCLLV